MITSKRVFDESFKGVSRKFQGRFKQVSRKIEEWFEGALSVIQGGFKIFQRISMGVSRNF